jgi:hypothetical protein
MEEKTKLKLVLLIAGLVLLAPFVAASVHTVFLNGVSQFSGEFFTIDGTLFMRSGPDVYVNLATTWWRLMPNTYVSVPATMPEIIQLTADLNCHVEMTEFGPDQICSNGGSGSGGGPN